MIFDLLHLTGRAVRRLPHLVRREHSPELALDGQAWRTPRHLVDQNEQLLAATAQLGLEGVIAKRLDAAYRECRANS